MSNFKFIIFPITLVLISILFSNCSDDNELLLRIRNTSDFNYSNIQVSTASDDHNYGDLNAGATTDYVPFISAYRYASIILQIDGQTRAIQPYDYTGETLLEPGNYTYEIDVNNNSNQIGTLSLTLVED